LSEKPSKLTEKVRTSDLLSLYGGLLSPRQKQVLQLYCDEDLGYSEIAEEMGITRQAVYDATRQGQSALEKYEEHLGLLHLQRSGPLVKARPVVDQLEALLADKNSQKEIKRCLRRLRGILWPKPRKD
jgi:hypothetical protein